jgi:hypothetical protein
VIIKIIKSEPELQVQNKGNVLCSHILVQIAGVASVFVSFLSKSWLVPDLLHLSNYKFYWYYILVSIQFVQNLLIAFIMAQAVFKVRQRYKLSE